MRKSPQKTKPGILLLNPKLIDSIREFTVEERRFFDEKPVCSTEVIESITDRRRFAITELHNLYKIDSNEIGRQFWIDSQFPFFGIRRMDTLEKG